MVAAVGDPGGVTDDVMHHMAAARQLADAAGAAYRGGGPERSMDDPGAWQLARAANAIERAAAERRPWLSYLMTLVVYPVAAWSVAELAGPVAGLSAGWAVAAAVAGFLVLCWPLLRLGRALDRAVGRRRLARARGTTRPVRAADGADVPALLRRCRRELAAATARRAGTGGAMAFLEQRELDVGLWWMTLADRSLCQAIMVFEPRRADR
jgi:hypothetical protein